MLSWVLNAIVRNWFLGPEPEFVGIGLRSPEIDSKESILQVYVAWRAGTTTLHRLAESSLESISKLRKRLQIRALVNI